VNSKGRSDHSPLSYATKKGHLDVTKLLLAQDNINVNLKDSDGHSLLSYAAKKGHLEVVQLFMV
jgi:ankyrin repeat protein